MDNIYDVANMSEEEAQSKAYELGWRGKEEFNGDPEKFKDAKTFLNEANNNIPMLRENFKKIEASNRRLQEQFEKMGAEVAQTNRRLEEAERRGYENAIKDIEARQRKAVEDGNLSEFDDLQKQKEQLNVKPLKQAPEQKGIDINEQIAIQVFESQNPWFRKDAELNQDMRGFIMAIKTSHPEMPLSEVLEKARERTIRVNADRFRETTRSNEVISSTGSTSQRLSYATLPAEDKAVFDREWSYMENELRLQHKTDEQIEQSKKRYQKNCLEMYK